MAKHAAVRDVPAPTPVKVAAGMATGRHRAPAGQSYLSGQTPVTDTVGRKQPVRKKDPSPSGQAKRKASGPLFTPRSSRTRYISYVGKTEMQNTNRLIAEWLAGVVIISIAVPLQGSKGYQKTMTSVMYRLTALTAVFFVLALVADTRAGRAAVWLGLLIDLGIIYNAVTKGTMDLLGQAFATTNTSQPGTLGHMGLAADITNSSSAVPVSGGTFIPNSAASAPGGTTTA